MRHFVVSFLILWFGGCASSGGGQKVDLDRPSDVSIGNPSTTLTEYLKRVPGVQVYGTGSDAQILVRGAMTANGNNSPLFVVDGTRFGRDLSVIQSLVPVDSIDRIRVLKGVEASSAYGLEGSAGVILIRTKKG